MIKNKIIVQVVYMFPLDELKMNSSYKSCIAFAKED